MNKKIKRVHGSWKSSITSDLIVNGGVKFSEIRIDGTDLYFLEGRPDEAGRYVIMKKTSDGNIFDMIPENFNSRNAVHEYGGGSFAVNNKIIFFTNWEDQRIYKIENKKISPLTEIPSIEKGVRYADLTISFDLNWLFCVRETHFENKEANNDLVAISISSGEIKVISEGRDFYSSPRQQEFGDQICWLEWDHPNMPWDGNELFTAIFNNGNISNKKHIDGSKEISIVQPEWASSGDLIYISDQSGWWNLKKISNNKKYDLLTETSDHGGPAWQFGFRTFGLTDENIILKGNSKNKKNGLLRIIKFNGEIIDELNIIHTSISDVSISENKVIYIGSSPLSNSEIIEFNLDKKSIEVIKESSKLIIDPEDLSVPEEINFESTNNENAYAYFYKPKNKKIEGSTGDKPPLLVISHGGPTSSASNSLNLSVQFWTNRGFAVVDVNYRGSVGYGRKFRDSLKGNWGIYDTDDCIAAVNFLSSKDLVDSNKVAIRGGSAGGYTTINALTFHDTFAVGATYYGIADLSVFIDDTHKFESKYLESLIGKYPEEKQKYYDRSAINFTDMLSCPMIIFQGTEDKIVPPSQAEILAKGLRNKKIPYSLVMFEGEQHGFRQSKNIKASLESELFFYSKVLGFETNEKLLEVKIENLS